MKDEELNYEEDNNLYRLRRELEDKLKNVAEEQVNEKVSRLQWRYGSIIAGFVIGFAVLGYTQISDIPEKIESALNSETSLNTITQIQAKGKKVDDIYTNAFNLLADLENNYSSVTDAVAKSLKQDSNFQKRIKGQKGDAGKNGENGEDGKNGKNGKDGIYAGILLPEQIGRFEVVRSQGRSILTFTDVTKEKDIKFVTFLLGPGFDKPIISPKKSGDKFTYPITVRSRFETTAIVYYKNKDKSLPTPYLFNVTLSP